MGLTPGSMGGLRRGRRAVLLEEVCGPNVVSGDFSQELDVEFLKEHLVAIDTHLRCLLQATIDFHNAYARLTQHEFDVDIPEDRAAIWDAIAKISHACWQASQILRPEERSPRRKVSAELKREYRRYVQKRGSQIRALLDLELSDKKSLADIRNHAVHADERLDEWYFFSRHAGLSKLAISYRTLANDKSPPEDPSQASLFWFDYFNGELHHLGGEKSYRLNSLKAGMELLKDGIEAADKTLHKKFGHLGRKSVFQRPPGWKEVA